MKQRNHRRTRQDEPQTLTKAVTHIRLEAAPRLAVVQPPAQFVRQRA